MVDELLVKLINKSLTKEELKEKVITNYNLLPKLINGMTSEKAAIRYGCGKILMELSEENPEKLYPHIDTFFKYLDSKYRIITWQAMDIIANLTQVDKEKKFDTIFEKYYKFINDEYMVTVANVVGHSGKIALAKPYLIQKITQELLKVEHIKTSDHLTDECKRVIAEKAISSFDMFFDRVKQKNEILSFVKKHSNSSRKTLKASSEAFLQKWNS